MERVGLPDDYHFFEIQYFSHPDFPYIPIKQEQATESILSHFQEEYHPFIYYHQEYRLGLIIYFLQTPEKHI